MHPGTWAGFQSGAEQELAGDVYILVMVGGLFLDVVAPLLALHKLW